MFPRSSVIKPDLISNARFLERKDKICLLLFIKPAVMSLSGCQIEFIDGAGVVRDIKPSFIFIVKSLQKGQNSTNLLL